MSSTVHVPSVRSSSASQPAWRARIRQNRCQARILGEHAEPRSSRANSRPAAEGSPPGAGQRHATLAPRSGQIRVADTCRCHQGNGLFTAGQTGKMMRITGSRGPAGTLMPHEGRPLRSGRRFHPGQRGTRFRGGILPEEVRRAQAVGGVRCQCRCPTAEHTQRPEAFETAGEHGLHPTFPPKATPAFQGFAAAQQRGFEDDRRGPRGFQPPGTFRVIRNGWQELVDGEGNTQFVTQGAAGREGVARVLQPLDGQFPAPCFQLRPKTGLRWRLASRRSRKTRP